MEQSPVLGPIFHGRIISLLSLLLIFDYIFITTAYSHTLAKGASVQIVFGFEYAILLVSVLSTGTKYLLHSIEIRIGDQWENKGVFMLYADLILGFFRSLLYMIFMLIMMKIHTFPLFAIRPMFIAMRAFRKSCADVIESRRAIRSLNTLYPDLNAEELAAVTDTTCIICREEMLVQQSIKRLGCQHIFHKNCLRSWFQRQQTCPICRTTVLRPLGAQLLGTPRQVPVGAQAVPAAGGATPPPNADGQPPPSGVQAGGAQAEHNGSQPLPSVNPTSFNLNNTSNTNHPTEQSQQFSIPFGSFPAILPPFAFPPPILPSLNFSGMSEESIRAMEGTEVQHVQARIQCLRNVRNLLDASMLQIQTYMNIVQTQSQMDNSSRILRDLNLDTERVLQQKRSKESVNELPNAMNTVTAQLELFLFVFYFLANVKEENTDTEEEEEDEDEDYYFFVMDLSMCPYF
ncbi:unnamed protein product [Didymodactylos carnosus]|uniref:RING-type E3 ubiquitin transferase n=1 Tax=Didymodactylos carnosus TaxID=1234261 RepID=A0A813RTI3_9BILA|nr:unnamed protein product [Didymodactylos carnosus]CAF3568577.1 unnamed protein product [Didymodactylos carnosus]